MEEELSLEFCCDLPKVELHAHLHGCLRDSTIRDLLETDNKKDGLVTTFVEGERTLEECFHVFTLMHRCIRTEEHLFRITQEVIMDFASDNVKYLELRTTPRCLSGGINKKQYLIIISRAITALKEKSYTIPIVRIIVSVDRSGTLDDAFNTIELAGSLIRGECEEVFPRNLLVGVDFCGNPHLEEFRKFSPVFERAKQYGLKTCPHLGELWSKKIDSDQVLDFIPNRVGHAVCLSNDQKKRLKELRIPIEVCATSNIKTRIVEKFSTHPFGNWLYDSLPLCICSDDSGLFNITLSSEYYNLAKAFHISCEKLFEISYASIDHCFIDDSIKKKLFNLWDDWKKQRIREYKNEKCKNK